MSRGIVLKFMAFLLAACALVTAAGSLIGVAVLGSEGLYDTTPEEWLENTLQEQARYLGDDIACRYASEVLGGCPDNILNDIYGVGWGDADHWQVTLSLDGEAVFQDGTPQDDPLVLEFTADGTYYAMPKERYMAQEAIGTTYQFWDWEDGEWVEYTLYQKELPSYTVRVEISPEYVTGSEWTALEALYGYRYPLIFLSAVGLLVFAACAVYLCWAAGRSPGSELIRPGGLNRLPLDLYALAAGVILYFGLWLGVELTEWTFRSGVNKAGFFLDCLLAVALSLVAQAFLYALTAQLKARCWWKNSLVGRCLGALRRGLRRICRWIAGFCALLPAMWQWLLVMGAMAGGTLLSFLLAVNGDGVFVLLFCAMAIGCVGLVCYGGWCFGVLLSGVRKMNQGHLDHRISTK